MSPVDVPIGLLTELRNFHASRPLLLDQHLPGLLLRRLPWGAPNRYFAWRIPTHRTDLPGCEAEICLKLHTGTPQRASIEMRALDHVANAVTAAPRVLWQDRHRRVPVTAMTLLVGDAVPRRRAPVHEALRSIAAVLGQVRALPLGPFAAIPRARSLAESLEATTRIWPATLINAPAEHGINAEMLTLLGEWRDTDDCDILAEPAPVILSPGNSDLDQWLWDSSTRSVHLVDWESAGCSDTAFDAADLVEHPSVRTHSDDDWMAVLPELGVYDETTYRRFRAARRLLALYWLSELWDQRGERPMAFADQRDRTRSLLKPTRV
ncbi:phosphotransferase [Actinocrispum wychmicini]|uniref:Phosphotransferase family enzyme n=1 Tax=Actinocrispum wychmicini TaxID=1213861 RepID=A0A4R2IH27_9PSEU|nr:phosphotransferase [Actinocrispum wychmicini]TCO43747.1 phosphotransferase family enzyme [Actinocrispum wychmicini]